MAAWEALIALFFAMAQIMRLCTEYEQINKSPFASYHQEAQAIAEEWGKEIHACSVGKLASMTKMTLVRAEYSTASVDERFVRLKTLDQNPSMWTLSWAYCERSQEAQAIAKR